MSYIRAGGTSVACPSFIGNTAGGGAAPLAGYYWRANYWAANFWHSFYWHGGGGGGDNWILATGFWNDSGVWIDGDNWID